MIVSKPVPERTLGQILVANNTISQEQLELALKIKDAQPEKYLGEILFQIGVPQEKINRALCYSNKRKTIGEILIDQELVSSEQLEAALANQKHIKEKWQLAKPLGRLLIEMGYINSRGYLTALSKHFNMPVLSMKNCAADPQLQKIIGKRYAMEYKVIVIENGPNTIKLVLAEPSSQIMEELRKAVPAGKAIEYYLASYIEIDECLRVMADSVPAASGDLE